MKKNGQFLVLLQHDHFCMLIFPTELYEKGPNIWESSFVWLSDMQVGIGCHHIYPFSECCMSGFIDVHILKVYKDWTKPSNHENFREVLSYKNMPTCITTLLTTTILSHIGNFSKSIFPILKEIQCLVHEHGDIDNLPTSNFNFHL